MNAQMATDPKVIRYMASAPGSQMAVNSLTMRIFDDLHDAMMYASSVHAYTVYELSPVRNPRKINVRKYFRGLK